MSLMERMKVASDLQNMSIGEKFLGGLQVTMFGMAVVFVVLLLLFLVIKLLESFLSRKENKEEIPTTNNKTTTPVESIVAETSEFQEDEQLVAVIAAAVAASLHTSTHNIIVRNIVRVPDTTPAWGRLSRMQQINKME